MSVQHFDWKCNKIKSKVTHNISADQVEAYSEDKHKEMHGTIERAIELGRNHADLSCSWDSNHSFY